ncbi:O-antigen ligase family protein [Neobacillus niacini]|uniref:O-antigen ligase family protein n=1 Tax=Neobacillus niacini TaxID=86668 RepID=UPI0007AB4B5B|nr:O-antigen ligase family protein [Neobacillus niacini]MEC1525876.1 O-antigen ligase family protein [Neobacillus niacini]
MAINKYWIEVFLRNYLKFIMFSMPFLIGYIPFLSETLALKSPFIIGIYYGPLLLSVIWFKDIIHFKTIKYYTVIILISIITLIWSIDVNKGITNIFLLVSSIAAAYLLYLFDYRKLWAWFSWGMLVFTILLKLKVLYFFLDTYNFGGDRLGYIEGQFATDPNFLGMYIGIALFYFISTLKNNLSKKINKTYIYIHLAACLLLIYFLFLTLSRTITLSLILTLMLTFVVLVLKNNFKEKKVLIKTLSISLVSIILLVFLILNSPLSSRFKGLLHDDRIDIWKVIWGLIGKFDIYSFFGYGLGSSDLIIGKYFHGAVSDSEGILRFSAHNLYFDWLLQTGLIGFGILLYLLAKMIKVNWKSLNSKNIDLFLISTFFLICSFGINTFGHYSLPVMVGLIISTLLTKESTHKGTSK